MQGTPVQVTEITSEDDAHRLAPEWSALVARALDPEPFITPEWCITWWRAFGTGRMKLLAARQAGELIGVAPLCVVPGHLLRGQHRQLELWSNAISNRAHFVLEERRAPEAARALLAALFEGEADWDSARLGPLAADCASTRVLTDELAARGATWGLRGAHASPYLDIPATWAEVEASLSGSFRSTVRRTARKAEKAGDVAITHSGERATDVDAAFAISEHTWQHDEGTGIGSTPDVERFYRELARVAAERGWLRMAYLQQASEPVAFEYNLGFGDVLYNLKLGYRAEAGRMSPGLVLRKAVLERCVEERVRTMDFLGDAESYKLHWTQTTRALTTIWVHRRGVRSRLAHVALFRVRPFVEARLPWVMDLKRRLRRSGAAPES